MKKSRYFIFYVLVLLLLLVSIYHLFYLQEADFIIEKDIDNREHLAKYGFCICKNVISNTETDLLKTQSIEKNYKSVKTFLLENPKMKNMINDVTGSPDYIFQDYVWIIQKSSVHTCHRDNNGDFFNDGQQHPSYTALVYLEDMSKCLAVIPKSHIDVNSYFFDLKHSLRNVLCNKGDVIIFNANLIHVGTLNNKPDNLRVQLKITHKDDIQYIHYYQNFNKILNKENTNPVYLQKIQRHISCMAPGFSNLTQKDNISSSRGTDNGAVVGYPQQVFSYLFYGNKNFYNLPNAF